MTTTSTQNFWWDFAQTGTFAGQTQFGRGGGASTTPCGYYVVYTLENPGPQIDGTAVASTLDVALSG